MRFIMLEVKPGGYVLETPKVAIRNLAVRVMMWTDIVRLPLLLTLAFLALTPTCEEAGSVTWDLRWRFSNDTLPGYGNIRG
jgi:hypothetical protein